MYGTIGHLVVKPGLETTLIQYLREFEGVPIIISSSLYCIDASSHDYYWTIVWTSKEAHGANASSAEFPATYERLLTMLASDPEWHSGECVYSKLGTTVIK